MLHNQTVGLVIPAFNEEQSITHVLQGIPNIVDFVTVVDNGSTDSTARLASAAGATVVSQPVRGYGAACIAGIRHLNRQHQPDLIAFMDADFSDYPEDLIDLCNEVASGRADLAIGNRSVQDCESESMFWHQRLGNWIICCVIYVLHGARFGDLGPMRCINSTFLKSLRMSDMDFGWTVEMQLKSQLQQARISQLPVRYRPRIGHSKISGTIKGTLLAAYKMLYWVFRLYFARVLRH
ncbi:MAG: glycosyltransferase family 2 protein [Pseudomonadota bacterium]